MKYRNLLALAATSLVTLAGCDAGSFVGSEPVDTPVSIAVDLAQYSVSGISVEVTGPGITQPIIANLPIAGDSATGQVRVLSGSDRAFLVRAFDANSMETHRGGDTLDILADLEQSVDVALAPLTGSVDLGATVGDYTVTVNLPTATLAVGETLQATVTVVDANGNTLQAPQVTWGSSNPSIASVDANGMVAGLVSGQTTIAASYEGFGGVASLSVH